ncbi:MAG: hypothetical protein DI537_23885 [Stutzerimonas stutzeri]|nr:MAG: hypothetical protein DI537_23885 [Stutzerimonas stutzeri]
MTNTETLAVLAMLQAMAIKLARHEAGDDFADALEALRDSCQICARDLPLAELGLAHLGQVEAIRIRAQAQAIIAQTIKPRARRGR